MTAARGPEDLHRRAEEGDEYAQLRLGDWFARNGYLREALKCFEPLAEAGDRHALMMVTAVVLSLARASSRYRPSAEAVLRSQGKLVKLACEMRRWKGREADARELLVRLAVEEGDREAVSVLIDIDHDSPEAVIQWHCLDLELGSTSWRELDELMQALHHQDGTAKLRDRARHAVRTAQRREALLEAQAALAAAYTPVRHHPPAMSRASDAAIIVGAAAAVPFAQAIATQAGSDFYAWVRQLFSRAAGRNSEELTERIATEAALYVVGEPQTNTWLEMRGRPTDEALAKLAETDLETLAAPDPQGRAVTVCWVPAAGQWQRRVQEPGGR
ncbi:hypothetical protein [Streptomyces sp. NPDC046925]|uniref:hypothetical protein n=1 Tax=Streptomyces sp. NPDC046925 TaxID=3155375 RepID=UPI0033D8E43E